MCGRFGLYSDLTEILETFGVTNSYQFTPSYNICPSQLVTVVYQPSLEHRKLASMKWGLILPWQKNTTKSYSMINARIEAVATKPSYRQAVRKRRCIIVANGFYEWKLINKVKQPYYIQLASHELIALAGIWEPKVEGYTTVDSCAIITAPANEQMKYIHDRMPAILTSDEYNEWLDTENGHWSSFISPSNLNAIKLEIQPVSKLVNNPRNDSPACINPSKL